MSSQQRKTMMKNRTKIIKTVPTLVQREAREKEKLTRERVTSLKKKQGPRQIDSQERPRT